MKIYLVGGAIRDKILGLPIKERDWVVTGSNVKKMIKLGYKKIGKSFPVFIHPKSKEEYALARTEIKNGFGYHGFKCLFSEKTSLKDDLYRRDITINSIAQDKYGNFIDPFNGLKDLKNKLIKYVSKKFLDDPLRLLRIARFYSYLYHLNFKIELNTFRFLKKISKKNELKYLSTDRIWIETKKSMLTKNPECYFRMLYSCNAIKKIFPEIYNILKLKKNISIKNILNKINIDKNLNNDYIFKFSFILFKIIKFFLINFNDIKIRKIIKINLYKFTKRFNIPNKLKNIINNLINYFDLYLNLVFFNINKIFYLFIILNLNNKNNFDFVKNILYIKNDKKIVFINKFNNISYTKENILNYIFILINEIQIETILMDNYKKYNIKNELILRQKKNIFSKLYV